MKNIYKKALIIFLWLNAVFYGFLIHGRFGWVGIIIIIIVSYLILLGIPNLIEMLKKKKSK